MNAKLQSHTKFWICKGPRTITLSCLAGLLFGAGALPAAPPANPLVEMLFSEGPGEGAGLTTANQGTLGGTGVFADLAGVNPFPAFSTNVPVGAYVPGGNTYSVDFGTFSS